MRQAHNRIDYKHGEEVNGVVFVKEAAPYLNPPNGKKFRRGVFECPYCGLEFTAVIGKIRTGHTQSCGCYKLKRISESNTKHGLVNHPIHRTWARMKQRCTDINNPSYPRYGGRGIKICDEWGNDFKAFYDYVSILSESNKLGYSIDRIDNNGNYEPGNVRWADDHTQCANRRKMKNNTSGYTGVSKNPYTWSANIRVNGELKHLGNFKTPKESVEARNRYIKENNLTEYPIQAT